jgi:uncharacterized protein (UPF0335 family)
LGAGVKIMEGGKSCHGDILKKYVDKLERLEERKTLLSK